MDKDKMEVRSVGEIRSISDEGILDAYLTRFGSIDEYQSTFTRGAFKKTFSERGNSGKIKLLWNHDHDALIGHVIEAREDDYGPLVSAKINLETSAGRDAFAHLRAGDVTEMSFGFNVIQDKMVNNVREINEVRVMEASPVLFPANSQAKIVSIRAEDFNETLDEADVMNRGWRLTSALMATLEEIWWNAPDVAKIKTAIESFKTAYTAWAKEYLSMANRSIPTDNTLSRALYDHSKGDLETLAKETSFTMAELRTMAEGKALNIEKRDKLVELTDAIREAHHNERRKAVESLCDELRAGGFDTEEMKTFKNLLENKESGTDISETVVSIRNLRKQLAA